ncbi:sterol-sensing domain of SREBP cleavage-activation-domain-containing protein [Pestalotiopsis sp. NC0098]|nr:sterol-sensing domain of SREBP cleavage-activation-domain-containing protein [Pestalotiopsis sp. NC0098]
MARLTAVIAAAAALLTATATHAEPLTPKHEPGRCAIRGHCGKKSFFGKELPCLDNGLATPQSDIDDDFAQDLESLCGPKWRDSKVCCNRDQLDALKSSMSTPNQIIGSCPACKDNFYNLFCTFTCSPDQSLFINVTRSQEKSGKQQVLELDQLISKDYGTGFYDSCKDVKFGPSNSKAIDFIGGGAKNYSQLLKFLGDEKAIGSPFQINFPTSYSEPKMSPRDMKPKKCNDEDPAFRCSCVDCPAECPELPRVERSGSCKVGVLPCLSFASIFTYSVLLFSLVLIVAGHVAWRRHARKQSERLHLLQQTESDDDDEGDLVRNGAMYDRPQNYYKINTWCDSAFSKLGHVCARFPAITIFTSLLLVIVLSVGWVKFDVERQPEKLWVSPTSAAAQEKAFFDENFGPFYRAEKAFLVNDTGGPVLSGDVIEWWMSLEKEVKQLKSPSFGARLQDVCFKPTGSACVVQSVAAYWDNLYWDKDSWRQDLQECARSPVNCRPDFGQPMEPNMVLGGYEGLGDVVDAPAMTATWVVSNYAEGSSEVARAQDWELALKDRLLQAQEEASNKFGLRLSFSTEISLEQELNKSTNSDATIVVISYIVMFIYASLALGSTSMTVKELIRNPAVCLVQSKFTLGFVGILIVLMSITSSIGLFSWAGIKATLIIAEVIPFIVLAVGVDNIFLIVHEFERVNVSHPDAMVEERIAKALGRMGPSILFSAITETVSFALGAFVGMPAVRNFAIYAAGAVFINALLQMTLFISILSYNQIRTEDHRADCIPCVQIKAARVQLNGNNSTGPRPYDVPEESWLQQFIRKHYAPALLGKKTKVFVMVIFTGLLAAGIALIPEVQLGLDQRVALPDDSYLIPYFNDLYNYLDTGPPVYFVTKDLNATQRGHQREICSRFTSCDKLSLTNILEQERKRPAVSYISSPTASWVDDFFLWLNPDYDTCCVEGREACFANRNPPWNITMSGMPEGDEFVHYLKKFLSSPTDDECPLGGQASYSQAVAIDEEHNTIRASNFRTMHKPLRSQNDFIDAYAAARRIANDFSASTGVEVFPYSVFYVFFDQYAGIVGLSATLLGSAIAVIFAVATVLLGSLLTALAVTLTVAMTVVDIIGAMAVFDVSLNAVSLVNLIICVGISVEFCAHIARAFMFPSGSVMERAKNRFRGRDARAWTALVNVGGSVFSGITVTKLLGVCVLAFTRSKIFEIYYFRVWLALVVFAATHALIFLPVLLSLVGGEGYVDPESEGGLVEDLANRRYRALVPDDMTDSEDED